MAQQGMVIDLRRCAGCGGCVVACQMQNNTRPSVHWVKLNKREWVNDKNKEGRSYLPHACMHCDDAPCEEVCPTGATHTREDGIVMMDYEKCINCKQCIKACPYDARTPNEDSTWYFDAKEPSPYEAEGIQRAEVVEKCIYCYSLVDQGKRPACALNCPGHARIFGDTENPESEISSYIKKFGAVKVGTTNFYYVPVAGMPTDLLPVADGPTGDQVLRAEKQEETSSGGVNPVVVGAGIAAVAAVGVGVAVKAKGANKDE